VDWLRSVYPKMILESLVLLFKLGFALAAAEGDGFAVFVFGGDAGISVFAADWALVSRQSGGGEGEESDGEE
jgi:hypothetical protein